MFLIGASYTVEDVGAAVAGYAYNLLEWGNEEENYYKGSDYGGPGPALRYNQRGSPKNRLSHPTLDNPNPELPWFYDCSSFTAAMYNMVCNQEIFPWGFTTGDFASCLKLEDLGPVSSNKDLCIPGDIICTGGHHVEIFISKEKGTGGAHDNYTGNANAYSNKPGQVNCAGNGVISPSDGHIYRLKQEVVDGITDLNKDFSVKGGSSYGKAVNYSNFFFNGIPDGSYSLATRKSIFETLIDALSSLYNYLVGLLTYILRGVIISFISIFDRLINNTFSSLENSGTSKSLQDSGVSATSADDPASINRSITIEDLIFNKTDIFDINIFRVD